MLGAAESMMLAQIQSVDEAKRQKDMLYKLVRDNRLMAEKLLESEKSRRRAEKVEEARKAFSTHIAELQREISSVRLEVAVPDFAGVIKGLKTLASIQDKIDTALANSKIAADQQAADVRTKLGWINENAAEYRALLADLQQLIAKPLDDFKLVVKARIDAHRQAEEARLEAGRERIRAEEEKKAKAEVEARMRAEQQVDDQPEKLALANCNRSGMPVAARGCTVPSPGEWQDVDPTHAELLEIRSVAVGLHTRAHQDEGLHSVLGDSRSGIVPSQPGGDAIDSPPTLKLGQINERLSPITLTADGLASLGFAHAATDKSAKLYHECDFPLICAALVRHIQAAQTKN